MNEKASLLAKDRAGKAQVSQAPQEAPAQTAGDSAHGGELSKYANLASELQGRVRELALLGEQRASLESKGAALKTERSVLEQKLLDGANDAIEAITLLEDSERLNRARLSGIAPRIDASELALQNALAPAGARLERLRTYLRARALERATGRLAALLEPSWRGRPEVLSLAEHELEYAQVASLALPSTGGWATTRPINEVPVNWNSMTRPYSKEEIALARAQSVDAIKSTAEGLVENGRKIIEACAPFAEGVPEFDWTEPVQESKSIASLAWLEPLGSGASGDQQFALEVCRTAGKDMASLSETDQRILKELVAQKRINPVAHASFAPGSPMLGSTVNPAETPGFGGPAE